MEAEGIVEKGQGAEREGEKTMKETETKVDMAERVGDAVGRNGALLLSAKAVASLLSIAPRSVWRLRSAGKMPRPVRLGGRVLWRRADIEKWVGDGCPVVGDRANG